jgi:hypothetical protein
VKPWRRRRARKDAPPQHSAQLATGVAVTGGSIDLPSLAGLLPEGTKVPEQGRHPVVVFRFADGRGGWFPEIALVVERRDLSAFRDLVRDEVERALRAAPRSSGRAK